MVFRLYKFIRAFFRVEQAGKQVVVDSLASPCVDGGIVLLVLCKFLCFPVGKTLVFGYPLPENYAIYFLQAVIGYLIVFYKRLQFNESLWVE